MPLRCLYLFRPLEHLLPGLNSWLVEAMAILRADPNWDDCAFDKVITYDPEGWFDAQSAADRILNELGPVVMLHNVQTPPRLELKRRVGTRTVFIVRHISESTGLCAAFEDARIQFESGDPRLPRLQVLALLLMNKLEKEHMWGGKNKGYKWAGDMPVGRGMPPEHAGQVPNLISLLLGNEIFIRKTSQGKSKYALNPEIKPSIYDALRRRSLDAFPALQRIFERDPETLSARMLDEIHQGE